MGENKFQWDDKNVADFCEFAGLRVGKNQDIRQQVLLLQEDFKQLPQSKTITLDYEIVEYKIDDSIFVKTVKDDISNCFTNDDYYWSRKYGAGYITNGSMDKETKEKVINSVKRLSDGKIFKIGDETNTGIINGFKLDGNILYAYVGSTNLLVTFNESIQKLSPLLFTTEDGVEIRNPETDVWIVWEDDNFKVQKQYASYAKTFSFKKFISREYAHDYAIKNKPLKVSWQELMDRLHGYFIDPVAASENLKQLAQSKIDSK